MKLYWKLSKIIAKISPNKIYSRIIKNNAFCLDTPTNSNIFRILIHIYENRNIFRLVQSAKIIKHRRDLACMTTCHKIAFIIQFKAHKSGVRRIQQHFMNFPTTLVDFLWIYYEFIWLFMILSHFGKQIMLCLLKFTPKSIQVDRILLFLQGISNWWQWMINKNPEFLWKILGILRGLFVHIRLAKGTVKT